jgi:hypothetical protein
MQETLNDYRSPYEAGESFGQFEAKEGGWDSADQAEQAYAYWFENQNIIDLKKAQKEELQQFKKGWLDGFMDKI